MQIDKANNVSPHTIIVPLTTKIKKVILPSHVFVSAGNGGVREDSVVLREQIRVIDKQRIMRTFGHLNADTIQSTEKAIKNILGMQ